MVSRERYEVAAPTVIHQMIDGEVMVVHLERGHYYSLVDCGAALWELLAAGATADEATLALEARYSGAGIAAEVARFIAELVGEGLLRATDVAVGVPPAAAAAHEGARTPFEAPKWTKYVDLEALLMVDPIHEVDDKAGWPNQPQ